MSPLSSTALLSAELRACGTRMVRQDAQAGAQWKLRDDIHLGANELHHPMLLVGTAYQQPFDQHAVFITHLAIAEVLLL